MGPGFFEETKMEKDEIVGDVGFISGDDTLEGRIQGRSASSKSGQFEKPDVPRNEKLRERERQREGN